MPKNIPKFSFMICNSQCQAFNVLVFNINNHIQITSLCFMYIYIIHYGQVYVSLRVIAMS